MAPDPDYKSQLCSEIKNPEPRNSARNVVKPRTHGMAAVVHDMYSTYFINTKMGKVPHTVSMRRADP